MSELEDKMNELENRISHIEQLLIKNKCDIKTEQPSESNENDELKSMLKLAVGVLLSGTRENLANIINDACENKNSQHKHEWTVDDISYVSPREYCYSYCGDYGLCDSCNGYSKLLRFLSDY